MSFAQQFQQQGQYRQPQRMVTQEQLMKVATSLNQALQADTQGLLVRALTANPDFARFMEANRGKSVEQAFADCVEGCDLSAVRSVFGPTR